MTDGYEGDITLGSIADVRVAVCDGTELADIITGRGDGGSSTAGGVVNAVGVGVLVGEGIGITEVSSEEACNVAITGSGAGAPAGSVLLDAGCGLAEMSPVGGGTTAGSVAEAFGIGVLVGVHTGLEDASLGKAAVGATGVADTAFTGRLGEGSGVGEMDSGVQRATIIIHGHHAIKLLQCSFSFFRV